MKEIVGQKDATLSKLQDYMEKQEQVECEVEHTFCEGLYIRTLHVPQGVLIVGKRHRHKTVNMLLKGTMTIYDGKESTTYKAPFMFEADKYSKKAGYADEDSTWVNIHVTDERDLTKLEEICIIPEDEYQALFYENKEVIR